MALYKILAVDSEFSNLKALERTLRREYNVFLATNGEDALAILEQSDIALIIAEYQMTDMNGVEILERALKKHPDVIRIILTTYADEKVLLDAIDAGHIYGYLTKPWEPEEVIELVGEAMGTYEVTRTTRDPHIRVLLHSGVITREQLETALQTQKAEEKSIGDILLEHGVISKTQLDMAIELQESKRKQLGEVLIEIGAISDNDLETACDEQRNRKRKLAEIIVSLGYADEESIYSAYALQLGMPHISLAQFSSQPDLVELVPPKLIRKHSMIPRDLVGKVLVVAVSEPLSDRAKSEIEKEIGYKVMSVSASHQDIEAGLAEYNDAIQEQEKKQEVIKDKAVEVGLDGIVQFQHTDDIVECMVRYIAEDCSEAVVFASDSRICVEEDVDLKVLLPTERSPIICAGKIISYSESDGELFRDQSAYLVRVSINDISRIDRRRLDLVIAQKKAFISSSYGLNSAS